MRSHGLHWAIGRAQDQAMLFDESMYTIQSYAMPHGMSKPTAF